jgi:hypothetical protein
VLDLKIFMVDLSDDINISAFIRDLDSGELEPYRGSMLFTLMGLKSYWPSERDGSNKYGGLGPWWVYRKNSKGWRRKE